MPTTLRLVCPSCRTPYALPEAARAELEGTAVCCAGCGRWWVPMPSSSGPPVKLDKGRPVRSSLRLEAYLLGSETSATPGGSIPDHERSPKPVTAPKPVAPPSPTPPPPVRPPDLPRLRDRPMFHAAGTRVDVRDLLQDFALDEGPGGRPFEESGRQQAAPAEFDGDMTITDPSARGFLATRAGDPLKDLDLQLVRTDGPAAGRVFQVTKSPLVIGRVEGDLIIQDRRVSGKHAQLDVNGPEMYALKDLASTNGTTINGRPISIATLKNGDVIGFGGVSFRFVARVLR